jgi:hypothetical protein
MRNDLADHALFLTSSIQRKTCLQPTPTGTAAAAAKAGSKSELLFAHILRQFQKFSKYKNSVQQAVGREMQNTEVRSQESEE